MVYEKQPDRYRVPHPLRVSKGAGLDAEKSENFRVEQSKTRTLAKTARVRHPGIAVSFEPIFYKRTSNKSSCGGAGNAQSERGDLLKK